MTQQTLTDYQATDETQTTATADGSPYRAAHTGENRYQHDSQDLDQPRDHCQHCGRPVSIRLRRVFGDEDDILWRCSDCAAFRELQEGAGADSRTHRGWESRSSEALADGGDGREHHAEGH